MNNSLNTNEPLPLVQGNQLELNNFTVLAQSRDGKKVQTSHPSKRRRQIVTKSVTKTASQAGDDDVKSNKTNTFDILSLNIEHSKYVTDRDR